MKVGLALGALNPTYWSDITVQADELGFESVWMPEHLVIPLGATNSPFAGSDHPPIAADVDVFDVFAYLGYLAARTERIHLGTYVYNLGLRHPFVAARAVATLDVISGGRCEFGIGAGWLAEEWEALGLDFASRGRRLDESLSVCRRLWTEPVVEHHGEFFDFGPVMFEPKPVRQPRVPIHVGGDGTAALRRAAHFADGWAPMNTDVEELPGRLAQLATLGEQVGRPRPVEVTLGGSASSPGDLARYAEAGVDRLIVAPWHRSADAGDALVRFADQVLHRSESSPC